MLQVCETIYLCDSISCWLLVELQESWMLNMGNKTQNTISTLTIILLHIITRGTERVNC